MFPTIINKFGTLIGWKAITLNLFGRDVEGITEITYSDNMDIVSEYGAGDMPIGEAEGNYSASGSISILVEEHIALLRSLPKGSRIQQVKVPVIPVVYAVSDVQTTDIIHNVRFTGQGREAKQADGKLVIKMPFIASHIEWCK